MTAVEEARTQLRARRKPREETPWRRPEASGFLPYTRVLSFDATLTHCGWAALEAWADGIEIIAKGTINPATDLTGYRGTWDKARTLHACLGEVIGSAGDGAKIIVEAPSVGGGSRTESSLIAGLLVTMTGREWTDISATHVSAVMLGDPQIRSIERKRRIREEVIRLVPGAEGRDYNEHIRDAIATGLTWLYDERERRSGGH